MCGTFICIRHDHKMNVAKSVKPSESVAQYAPSTGKGKGQGEGEDEGERSGVCRGMG